MVGSAVAGVEALRVASVQVAHAVREIGLGRLDDQVIVVAHQAADVHEPPVAPRDAPDQVDEERTVVVVQEDRAAVVPPCRDVVEAARDEVAARSRHDRRR